MNAIRVSYAVLSAPRVKQAKATKLPDGSFHLESVETVQ